MFKYHFKKSEILKIIALAETKKKFLPAYSQQDMKKVPAGAWLVGDSGVYFMSNATPISDKEKVIAYARESNPDDKTGKYGDYYDNKRAGYGGDDGSDYISLKALKEWATGDGPWLLLKSSPDGKMEFVRTATAPSAPPTEGGMNRAKAQALREAIQEALKPVEAAHGVKVSLGNSSYNSESVSFSKFSVGVVSADGNIMTPRAVDFIKHAYKYNMKPEDLFRTITLQDRGGDKEFKIVGIPARARSKQIVIADADGGLYNADPQTVKRQLDEGEKIKLPEPKAALTLKPAPKPKPAPKAAVEGRPTASRKRRPQVN